LLHLENTDGVRTAIHNKAVALTALNDFHGALASYQEARRIAVECHQTQAITQADYNIAWLYYLRGEYSRAIETLHAAAATAKETGDGYHAALSLLDLAEIYLELNLSTDAREMAEQARARFTDLGMGYEAAKSLAYVAIACGQEGRAFGALELFAEARQLFVQEQNLVWPSLIDLYQAVLLFDEGRLFEARRLSLEALNQFRGPAFSAKAALCDLLLARIALRLGDPGAAHAYCNTALERLANIGTPILTYHARLLLGHTASQLGDRTAAYTAYQVARETLESLRSRVRGEELKVAFAKNKIEVYERLIELTLERGSSAEDFQEAFGYVEQAKSRTLLDLIFQPVHALAPDASESGLAHSIRELREELNWYYHLVEHEQLRPGDESAQRVERFQREIGAREKEMARVLRELAVTEPRETELHEPCVCSVEEIRAALPPNGILVEFFQVDDRILLCLVDRQNINVTAVSVMARISTHIRLLQFQLSKFRLGAEYLRTFQEALLKTTQGHLQELFNELLAPVWPQLQGRHVIVVPHGALHYVPFHALFDGMRYVLDACTVSYAPSASIYARCHAQPCATSGPALVLGVPDSQAPCIEQEAKAVASALSNARLFMAEEATRQALTTHARDSRIVHIASHGYFRPDSPMFSTIRLGDGYLNVYDLYRLRIPAELVTLSGCATGANMAAAGDELLGITRGLFCAGAQALLLSLWNVHDESTARFMTKFYGLVAQGTAPVRALRDAMLVVRDETPHPYYWAPFALSGKCWKE
jgi:CHAT domain-containing protein